MIYLDNAATTSPKPSAVTEALYSGAGSYSANPGRSGHMLSMRCAEKLYRCRANISAFFGQSSPERCIFTYNCTTAINMVLKGTLKASDHVVISNLEHNAVIRPLASLSAHGVEVTKARVVRGDTDATVRNFKNAIKPNTKIIFCTHASNVSGDVLPIHELAALAAERGILFGIDAAQSAGSIPINMNELHADFICVPSHKGLYGVMGCGALLLSERAKLRVLIEGGTGGNSLSTVQPNEYPERMESGTVNLPGIIAMSAGVDFVNQHGTEKILIHELEFCTQLEQELGRLSGVTIHSCGGRNGRTAITTITFDGIDSETAAMRLSDAGFAVRGGLHCAPDAHRTMGTLNGGAVRISPSVFTNTACIPALVNTIKKW